MSPDEADLVVEIYRASARIFCEPPVYWKDFAGYQAWAHAKNLFVIERGIMSAADDTSEAGRKAFSRMRLNLQSRGLIWLTILSQTTRAVRLTEAGLTLAEKLTGEKAPASLWEATKRMEAEDAQESDGDDQTTARCKRVLEMIAELQQPTEEGDHVTS